MPVHAPPRPTPTKTPAAPERGDRLHWLLAGVTVAAALVALGLVLLARPLGSPPPDRGPVSSPSPAPDPARAVEAAYRTFWATYDTYGAQAVAFDQAEFARAFGPVATGAEYERLHGFFQVLRLEGSTLRGGAAEDLAPRVTLEGPGRATVRDCMADSGGLYDRHGQRLDTPTEGRETWVSTLVVDDGTWKVADVVGTGEPCLP